MYCNAALSPEGGTVTLFQSCILLQSAPYSHETSSFIFSSVIFSRMPSLWSSVQHVFIDLFALSMEAGNLSLCLCPCFVSWLWMGQTAGMVWGPLGGLHIEAVHFLMRPLLLGYTVEGVGRTMEVGWRPEQLVSTTEESPGRLLMDTASRTAAVEPEAWSCTGPLHRCCWGTCLELLGACDPGSPGGTGAEAGGVGSCLLHLGEAGRSSSSGDEGQEPATPRPGRR